MNQPMSFEPRDPDYVSKGSEAYEVVQENEQEGQDIPASEPAFPENSFTAVDARIAEVEERVKALADMVMSFEERTDQVVASIDKTRELIQTVAARTEELVTLVESKPTGTPQTLTFGPLTIALHELPKQDAFIQGVNSPGRPGISFVVGDGTSQNTVGRLEWDHQKQAYVLFTGKGVIG